MPSLPTVAEARDRVRHLLSRRELALLLILATLALGAWATLGIADEVSEGDTHEWDRAVLMLFRENGDRNDPLGPREVENAVRDVTALGSVAVISFLTIAAVAFLWISRRRRLGVFVLFASLGGAGLSYALKYLYDRPRPSFVPAEALPGDPSFPSGHSASSAVIYLTLALLLTHALDQRRQQVFVVAMAVVVALAVGVSRLYLGVHWPSDVLAGWALGAAWALACWQAERALRRRGLTKPSAS